MTVYNFNRGIGWASSGVEYAQIYRAKLLRRIGARAKFIFTDMFRLENIEHYTKNIGFEDDEIIWLYMFFTDFKTAPTTYTEEQLEGSFASSASIKREGSRQLQYEFRGRDMYVRAYRTRGSGACIQRAEYVSRGRLIRRDFFSSGRMFSEYYAPSEGKAVPYLRRYFNTDGSEAYEELINGDKSIFRFPDRIIPSKEHLIAYLTQLLHLSAEDVVIVDRAKEIGQAVFMNHSPSRLGVVIHADHYNESATDKDNILWNNYYEYEFSHAKEIDFLVSSTEVQNRLLEKQFRKYWSTAPRIATIPVGSLDVLRRPETGRRKRHALITASRLATEKHIDWLVRAVAAAREQIPDVTLDIYGKGGQEDALRGLIRKLNADDYIRLCGHHDLTEIYQGYEAYLSASTSEGFGLTLMEAVGSGLAIIGFDVRYGNQTFIGDGRNGYLIPYNQDQEQKEHIGALTDRIIRLCTEADMKQFAEVSYQIAAQYLTKNVEQAWRELIWDV